MHFCPLCGNLLLLEEGNKGMRFCCPTCPYLHNVNTLYSSRAKIKKKQVDDVLGGDDAWENVDRTSAKCPNCSHNEAYFMQIQIRSADEPSTTFYRCVKCSKQWNDNA
jgi:DNA-directed RNA polymerase III subunit RPC11